MTITVVEQCQSADIEINFDEPAATVALYALLMPRPFVFSRFGMLNELAKSLLCGSSQIQLDR